MASATSQVFDALSVAPTTLVLVLVTAAYLTCELYSFLRLRHVPGPRFAFSITKQWMFRKALGDRYHLELKEAADKYGALVRIGPDELLCTDPDVIRRMSGVRSGYTKGRFYESARMMAGSDNIISMRDEKEHKKLIERTRLAFANRPDALEEVIDKHLAALVHLIETKYLSDTSVSGHGKGSVSVPVDMGRIFQYVAFDIIGELSFSRSFDLLDKDEDVYKCVEINEASLGIFRWTVTFPWLTTVLLKWPLNLLAPKEGDNDVGFVRLVKLVSSMVKPRLGAEAQAVGKKDMLQACIEAGMSEPELVEMGTVLVVAGADSSAYAMSMTLVSLLTNPRAYARLRTEIDGAIAKGAIQGGGGRPATDAEAKKLPYLQAVLREGFRMFPPLIGLNSKQVPAGGDVINGYFVPGGTQVGHNTPGLGRLKSFWGADADVFRPERWLEAGAGTEREREMVAVSDLSFGWGKYQCLGKQIANMELSKVFVELLRRFDFGLVNATEPVKTVGLPFLTAKELWVVVSRR